MPLCYKNGVLSFIFFAMLLFGMPLSLQASTFYVTTGGEDTNSGADWSHSLKTIGKALLLAKSGDSVWVAQGNYIPTGTMTLRSGVGLYGGFYGNETKLRDRPDPMTYRTAVTGSNRTLLSIAQGAESDTIVNGFILQGAKTAISIVASSPTITQNLFLSNGSTKANGGAILCSDNAAPLIEGNTFRLNSRKGDGVTTGLGGAIYLSSSPAVILNNLFDSNSAPTGGAIASVGSDAAISRNSFVLNTATQGGAIALQGDAQGATEALIENNFFGGNNSKVVGGAIYGVKLNFRISQNTFVQNVSTNGGVVAMNDQACSGIFANNIVASNTAAIALTGGGDYTLSANCLWQNKTYGYGFGLKPGAGDIEANPRFVNTINGDYHIKSNSPCIDSGNQQYSLGGVDTDGEKRLYGKSTDMGCDEYLPKLALQTPSPIVRATTATVELSTIALEDTRVNLTSNSTFLTVPASVTIPKGFRRATFVLKPGSLPQTLNITVTARFDIQTVNQIVQVRPWIKLFEIVPSEAEGGWDTVHGHILLNAPAPNEGLSPVNASSSNPDLVRVQSSYSIPTGKTEFTFELKTNDTSVQETVVITLKYQRQVVKASLLVKAARTRTKLEMPDIPDALVNRSTNLTATLITDDDSSQGINEQIVEFYEGATKLGEAKTQQVDGEDGVATLPCTFMSAGDHTITSRFAGSDRHRPSKDAMCTVHVSTVSTNIEADPDHVLKPEDPNDAPAYGDTVTLSAILKDTNGEGIAGQILQFYIDGVRVPGASGDPVTGAEGVASIPGYVLNLTPGQHTFTVKFVENLPYLASDSPFFSFTVKQNPTSITVNPVKTSGDRNFQYREAISYSAQLKDSHENGIPNASLHFYIYTSDGNRLLDLGTASTDGAGNAGGSYDPGTQLNADSYTLKVFFEGDSNNAASVEEGDCTIDKRATSIAIISNTFSYSKDKKYRLSVKLYMTSLGSDGATGIDGEVLSLSLQDADPYPNGTTSGNGHLHTAYRDIPKSWINKKKTITATFAGDDNYAACTQNAPSLIINP